MKKYKKTLLLLFTASLALVLVACGEQEKKDGENGKEVNISDILNGKEERQIMMTEETDNTESPQVRWAGYIGNGKLDVHPYYQNEELEYTQLKDLNKKDFNDTLKYEDANYETFDKNGEQVKVDYGKREASLNFEYDDTDQVEGFMFDVSEKNLGNESDIASVTGPLFGNPKGKDDGWLVIETKEEEYLDGDTITPQVLYIKAKDNEKNIDISNA